METLLVRVTDIAKRGSWKHGRTFLWVFAVTLFYVLFSFPSSFFTPLSPLSGFSPPPSCTLHLVTMQIYLSHPAKMTGPTENAVATAVQASVYLPASEPPPDKAASDKRKVGAGKKPPCTLSLHRSTCQGPFSPADTPIYKSPIKSPSQYFQICY